VPVNFPDITGDYRTDISHFLRYVREFLDDLTGYEEHEAGGPIFVSARLIAPLEDFALAAWDEARPRFAILQDRVFSEEAVTNAALDAHGLTGAQLKFKLETVKFFNAQYTSVGRRILKKLIDVIDILLKSILAAIGAGEGLAEIKDYIKESLDLDG
jgi:hypothetical protein